MLPGSPAVASETSTQLQVTWSWYVILGLGRMLYIRYVYIVHFML